MISSRSSNFTAPADKESSFPPLSTRNSLFKTPGRSLKRGRVVHNENTIYGHPRTAGLTGRKKNNVTFSTPEIIIPSYKASRVASKSTALSEITNQTPFSKKIIPVTPNPAPVKPSTSFAIFDDSFAAPSARRVSSTRKKLRLPRSTSKSFQTPETTGDHWDVSDVSIEAELIEEVSIEEEDYDDVEYGPPTAIDPRYDPGFDMPNYKEVGATLMSLFRQGIFPEDYDPVAGFTATGLLNEIGPLVWEKIDLPDIPSDDTLPLVQLQPEPARNVKGTPRCTSAGPCHAAGPTRKTATSHTRIPSLTKSSFAQLSAPVNQTSRPVSHSRSLSTIHARIVSGVSGSTSIPRPTLRHTSTSGQKVGTDKQRQPSMPEDTVLSLLADPADEVLEKEFLFKL